MFILVQHWLVPIHLRKQSVDKNVILKRCNEELHLLVDEMKAYTRFYYDTIQTQERDIAEIENGLTGIVMTGIVRKEITVY